MANVPVLKIGEFTAEQLAVIDQEFTCYSEQQIRKNDALRERIEAILTRSICTIPPETLALLPKLKIIATLGVGYDGIPLTHAQERGIVVTNTPGVLDNAVCELAVGLLLSLLRQLPAADRHVRENLWKHRPFQLTSSLNGKKIGIVGLGRIGRGIATRLAPFGVSLAYSGKHQQDVPYAFYPTLNELASYADVLIVCCPGGESTRGIINSEVLTHLGANGFLVNVSRGSVVDETALTTALEQSLIRGAALDVFENEPLENSRLTTFDNTVLTPHVGSATAETRHAMLRLALDNLHKVLRGEPPLTPVSGR